MPIDHPDDAPIVFVITRGDSVGGAQIHVRDLAARLQAEGDTVFVLAGNAGAFTRDLDDLGVPWRICPGLARSINPFRDIRAVREVHRALLMARPRLVSTHTAKAGLVGRLAAAWAGVPVLFTAHGWQFAPGIPWGQRLLVYTLELLLSRLPVPSRVITVSRFDYRLARAAAAVPTGRLRLVYNGLPDRAGESGRGATEAVEPVRLIMIARFQAQKDHETLLRALADVMQSWELVLVGEEGPLYDTTIRLAGKLGYGVLNGGNVSGTVRENRVVRFLGHRSDVADLLGASDIYCLISNWEGLPRSIIEAMRAGLPVVATDVGGSRELVQEGITGRLVPRGEKAVLTETLQEMIRDTEARTRMGSSGRRRYEELFTFEAMYRNTRTVWSELVRSR